MAKGMIITKEHVLRCALYGACKLPKVGSNLKDFEQSDLIWAEKAINEIEKKEINIPIWALSSSGSGYGYGYGYGYGSGYGDGYGSGSGYGDGYGYGSGYGSGYGYGNITRAIEIFLN